MPTVKKPPSRRRGEVTADDVVAAAIDIGEGVDALTIRQYFQNLARSKSDPKGWEATLRQRLEGTPWGMFFRPEPPVAQRNSSRPKYTSMVQRNTTVAS